MHFLYNAIWRAAGPGARLWLARHPRHAAHAQRFAPDVPELEDAPVWVHACSVGELSVARPLLAQMQAAWPGIPRLLTASTSAGFDQAQKLADYAVVTRFPMDHPATVRRFFRQVRPRALALIETELWPNVLREAARAQVPVVVVNARLSDKHFARYRKWARLTRPMFASLAAVGAQSARYAERFAALGTPAGRIQVTGSGKFDGVATQFDHRERQRLRAECGIPPGAPVLVFGSTRPGDEALASACWAVLREEQPELRLVVAPRHPDRIDDALAPFGEPVYRRSGKGAPVGARVIAVDTLGELAGFYSIADLAVIGGSFYPGVDGHNPLEPAALGTPTLFGPYMNNFAEPATVLLSQRGAVQVACPEDLYASLSALLADATERRCLGTRGRKAVLENQGASRRNLALLAGVLGTGLAPEAGQGVHSQGS